MTDPARLADPVAAVRRLPRGAAVILRHYDDPDRAALARALAALCRARGLVLLVAGDARLARAVGAGGLHLPEGMVAAPGWRGLVRSGWLVTAAAHSPAALACAARAGAHAALLSPVFPTASHPGAVALGPLRFCRLAGRAPLPVHALGGVDDPGAARLAGARCAGFAAIAGLA
ncbi:MAG: thiamine phosphate synthase [Rhodobacterales bacterium]|nr:thiamine phosphate synthase [Rhodobacterales bacterium]